MAVKLFIEVIQGSDLSFNIRLKDKATGDPFDLGNTNEIKVLFPKESSATPLIKTLTSSGGVTILNSPGGRMQVLLNEGDTDDLKVGDRLDFEVEIQKNSGADTFIVQMLKKLTVKKRLFE